MLGKRLDWKKVNQNLRDMSEKTNQTADFSVQDGGEYRERLERLEKMRRDGINPYPSEVRRTHTAAEATEDFESLVSAEKPVSLCGRLRSKRVHGNLTFCDLQDGSGRFQVALSKKNLADRYKKFLSLADIGDFFSFSGKLFLTKAGVKTLMVEDWQILTKALRPIPSDHFGLKDEQERYRKRYLDLLLDEDLRRMFVRKSEFWRRMRMFLDKHGFLEVHTPTLEVTTGGAEARPFQTHHNDYDIDVYLRISAGELWQKRLMAAGFEKTYEIGRVWRNEGTGPNHLQEFTNVEFYRAYWDYRRGMKFVRELYIYLAEKVYGRTKFQTRGHKFDLADEWPEIDYRQEILRRTGVDVLSADSNALREKLDELGVRYDAQTKERLVDNLWKYCRRQVAGPVFLVGHPTFMAPLAKRKPDDPGRVEQFQVIIGGSEVGKGYSELNDPIDQRERFAKQQKLLEAGDDEAMMPDEDFVTMLEYGMPPTFGFGVGERLFAFLEDKTLREATLFPLMKPKEKRD